MILWTRATSSIPPRPLCGAISSDMPREALPFAIDCSGSPIIRELVRRAASAPALWSCPPMLSAAAYSGPAHLRTPKATRPSSTARTGPTCSPSPSVTPSRAQQAVLANTKVFGPGAVNEARLSFTRAAVITDQPTAGFGKISDFGFVTGLGTLGIIPSGPPGYEALPPLSFLNFSIGSPTLTTFQPNNTWHFSENFSKIAGRHTLKFGGEFRYYQINERNVCAPNGSFDFDGSETGNDIADYLLGAPSGYVQCSFQVLDSRSHYGGLYFQDSFRFRPSLTLNS